MADSGFASKIPSGQKMVAGYVDGDYVWSESEWNRFPDAVRVGIAVKATTNDGHVLDVENGNATPEESVGWVQMRRAAGCDPSVYCNLASWPEVKKAFDDARERQPHYWLAHWDGVQTVPAGAVAHQFASSYDYDSSVVADYWPGVDNGQTWPPAHGSGQTHGAQPIDPQALAKASNCIANAQKALNQATGYIASLTSGK